MKYFLYVLVVLFIIGCEQYPSNPIQKTDPEPTVQIIHKSTDYVDASCEIPGIAANKANILFFELKLIHFEATAIEVLGTVTLEGIDEKKEHTIHFYTDQLIVVPQGTAYEFNTIDRLEPESTYTLVRSKFPPNEYSPFKNNRGRIKSLTFCEVWAYDAYGEKQSVVIEK